MIKHKYSLSFKIFQIIKEEDNEILASDISKKLKEKYDVIKSPFEVASHIRHRLSRYVDRRRVKPSLQHYLYSEKNEIKETS